MKRVCMVILALVSGTMIYAIKDNLQFLQVQLGDLKKELDVLQDNLSKVKTEPKQRTKPTMTGDEIAEIWEKVLRNHGFTPYYDTRWLWVEDPYEPSILLKEGERPQLNLGSARLSTEKKRLAGFYKIHLMPTEGNIDDVFERLLVLIKNNKKLQDVVSYVKIMPRYGEMKARIEEAAQTGNLMYINPLIVVYPAEGKKNAQQALNIIYQAFKDTPGMNITPRFNAKVTDLIYVSQGDADFKSQPENQPYYEQPYKVYYSKEILPEDGDHYLRFPGTDKPITDVQ